jgi:hypothetical protein
MKHAAFQNDSLVQDPHCRDKTVFVDRRKVHGGNVVVLRFGRVVQVQVRIRAASGVCQANDDHRVLQHCLQACMPGVGRPK